MWDGRWKKAAAGDGGRDVTIWYFSAVRACRRRAVYRISAAWTGCIIMTYAYPPETILSHRFYLRNPRRSFTGSTGIKCSLPDAEPNAAHIKLAELEREGKLTAVMTQNIDGLHQKAGSGGCLSCTEAYIGITVCAVQSFMMRSICLR